MEIKLYKYYFIFLVINTICFGEEVNFYKIKFFGINAATCIQTMSDTTLYENDCMIIEYKVETTGLFNYLFKITNKYTTIIKKNNYETLYFHKDTVQPKVKNNISTELLNNNVKYSNIYKINKDDLTIFSLLYLLSKDKIDTIKSYNTIDREGKKYNFHLNQINNNQYILLTSELDEDKKGYLEHTDIFSWALFLPNTKKIIYIDSKNHMIDKCVFKKGILTFSAERIAQ